MALAKTFLSMVQARDKNFPVSGYDLDVAGKLDELLKGKVQAYVNHAIAITYQVTTGATAIDIFASNAPFKFMVQDVIVTPRNVSTNGTLKVTDGTNDITNAMVCAVSGTIVRAASIATAYNTINEGGSLRIVCAGDTVANTQAMVTVIIVPL